MITMMKKSVLKKYGWAVALTGMVLFAALPVRATTINLSNVQGPCVATPVGPQSQHLGFDTGQVQEYFQAVQPCHIEFQIGFDPIDAPLVQIAIDKDVFNNPDYPILDWKDFHIELAMLDASGALIQPDGLGFIFDPLPPVSSSGHFVLNELSDQHMLWFDGFLPVGETATFWLGIQVPNISGTGLETIVLWQIPTVPEPEMVGLLLLGLLGIAALRRRR